MLLQIKKIIGCFIKYSTSENQSDVLLIIELTDVSTIKE